MRTIILIFVVIALLFFGLDAKGCRGILPGVFAHHWTDIAAGIFRS